MISIEFCLITISILLIFIINIGQILYLILYKTNKQSHFYRLILLNYSFSSIIISIWILPFFYFRILWSPESLPWRFWSYLYHIVDAIQLYSLLLLITHFNTLNQTLQRFLILLSWTAPLITYSPILWLSSSSNIIDYLPYRRLSIDIPWWILPTIYSSMYLVPLVLSLILIILTIIWPWYYQKLGRSASEKQLHEHRETMAELTSLIETVLNFELEQSISSFPMNQTSLSYIPSISYKTSSSSDDENLSKQTSQISSSFLFCLTCLFAIVHLPYVIFSLLDMYTSHITMFIYLHWFGTILLPIVHLNNV